VTLETTKVCLNQVAHMLNDGREQYFTKLVEDSIFFGFAIKLIFHGSDITKLKLDIQKSNGSLSGPDLSQSALIFLCGRKPVMKQSQKQKAS